MAHWKFNDGLNDETGNHNGSMVDPSQSPTYVPGVDADCLQIFNQGTAVECANPNTFLRAHSFTMSVWFNATASGGNGEILLIWKGSKVKWGLPGGTQFEAYTGGGNVGAGNGIFIYTTDCGAFGENYTNENINVIDGNWHHAAVTYSTTTTPHFTLYLDGIGKDGTDPETMASLDTDFVMAADVVDTNQCLRVGTRDNATQYSTLVGLVDDAQLYNRALSSNEVQFLFHNPGQVVAPPAAPVIVTQPVPMQIVAEGTNAVLSVEVAGAPPLSFQWQFNGTNLPGATNGTLTLPNVTTNQSGNYTVAISNSTTNVASLPANVLVLAGGLAVLNLHFYAGVTLDGLPGSTYQIQYAQILGQATNWITVDTVTLPAPSTPFLWFDAGSINSTRRFYRAVSVP